MKRNLSHFLFHIHSYSFLAVRCSIFENVVDRLCFCATKPAFNSPVLCTIYGNIQTVPRFQSSTVCLYYV